MDGDIRILSDILYGAGRTEIVAEGRHKGIRFLITASEDCPRGFVEIPSGHPYIRIAEERDVRRMRDIIDCHGGVSYCGRLSELSEMYREYGACVGFTCSELGDLNIVRDIFPASWQHIWSIEELITECVGICEQISAADKRTKSPYVRPECGKVSPCKSRFGLFSAFLAELAKDNPDDPILPQIYEKFRELFYEKIQE